MHHLLVTLAAGALFGGASGVLFMKSARLAGISGIAAGVLMPRAGEHAWRVAFLVGMLAGGLTAGLLLPGTIAWQPATSMLGVVVAGLCIGVGASLANGCTSGHGICGVGRLAPRSIAAVVIFTVAGGVARWALGAQGGLAT